MHAYAEFVMRLTENAVAARRSTPGITGSCSKEKRFSKRFLMIYSSKVMKGRIDYMGGDVGPAARASSPPSCMAEQIANDAHLHKLLPPRSSSSTDDGALQARCREESVRD